MRNHFVLWPAIGHEEGTENPDRVLWFQYKKYRDARMLGARGGRSSQTWTLTWIGSAVRLKFTKTQLIEGLLSALTPDDVRANFDGVEQ
jgi:hypothetical protein